MERHRALHDHLLRWQATNAALDCLSDHERTILLGRVAGTSLRDLAKELGITQERARQVSERAAVRMTAYLFGPFDLPNAGGKQK